MSLNAILAAFSAKSVLEATYVVDVIRPFSTNSSTEIVSAPKVYGFDTGFICHARGWRSLRPEDLGQLWEHLVLNELRGSFQFLSLNGLIERLRLV